MSRGKSRQKNHTKLHKNKAWLQAALLEDKSLLIQETENLSIKDELLALGPLPPPPPGHPLMLESKSGTYHVTDFDKALHKRSQGDE